MSCARVMMILWLDVKLYGHAILFAPSAFSRGGQALTAARLSRYRTEAVSISLLYDCTSADSTTLRTCQNLDFTLASASFTVPANGDGHRCRSIHVHVGSNPSIFPAKASEGTANLQHIEMIERLNATWTPELYDLQPVDQPSWSHAVERTRYIH